LFTLSRRKNKLCARCATEIRRVNIKDPRERIPATKDHAQRKGVVENGAPSPGTSRKNYVPGGRPCGKPPCVGQTGRRKQGAANMKTPANDAHDELYRAGLYYHGTRADLKVGDLIAPGFASNYGQRNKASWVYFTATLDAAIWGAELAAGDGRERIYIVEPTGRMVDDPNLTDKKYPGNPTRSYRSQAPLRITGEVARWQSHDPERLQRMKDAVQRAKDQGVEAID
jgi:hypothetical protein